MKKILLLTLAVILSVTTMAQDFKTDFYEVSKIGDGSWRIQGISTKAVVSTMFLIEGDTKALLIDLGGDSPALQSIVERITKKPFDIVVTHPDGDHINAAPQFDKIHIQKCYYSIPNFTGELIGISDGFVFDLGGRTIEVIDVPGHSLGDVALLDNKTRFLYTSDAFGSGQTWLHLRPLALDVYLKSLRKIEGYFDRFDLIRVGHEQYLDQPLTKAYLLDMITLTEAILKEDTSMSQSYESASRSSKAKTMLGTKNASAIIYDANNLFTPAN